MFSWDFDRLRGNWMEQAEYMLKIICWLSCFSFLWNTHTLRLLQWHFKQLQSWVNVEGEGMKTDFPDNHSVISHDTVCLLLFTNCSKPIDGSSQSCMQNPRDPWFPMRDSQTCWSWMCYTWRHGLQAHSETWAPLHHTKCAIPMIRSTQS